LDVDLEVHTGLNYKYIAKKRKAYVVVILNGLYTLNKNLLQNAAE
jgi:hypothetical protein